MLPSSSVSDDFVPFEDEVKKCLPQQDASQSDQFSYADADVGTDLSIAADVVATNFWEAAARMLQRHVDAAANTNLELEQEREELSDKIKRLDDAIELCQNAILEAEKKKEDAEEDGLKHKRN